jgi:hypothetical protein
MAAAVEESFEPHAVSSRWRANLNKQPHIPQCKVLISSHGVIRGGFRLHILWCGVQSPDSSLRLSTNEQDLPSERKGRDKKAYLYARPIVPQTHSLVHVVVHSLRQLTARALLSKPNNTFSDGIRPCARHAARATCKGVVEKHTTMPAVL